MLCTKAHFLRKHPALQWKNLHRIPLRHSVESTSPAGGLRASVLMPAVRLSLGNEEKRREFVSQELQGLIF
jgi:hypothetical protein